MMLTSYALGLVHGLDSDHVIDVTDFVSQDPRPSQAVLFGSKFGIGHTFTVLVAGLLTYSLKTALPEHFEQAFTLFSGILLMLLGIWGIHRRIIRPMHLRRQHASMTEMTRLDKKVFRWGPLFTGFMTGLVGTAGVMLFGPVAAAPNIYSVGMFISIYGFGVISSMSIYALVAGKCFSSLFNRPQGEKLIRLVSFVPSFLSIGLGTIWVVRFVEGVLTVKKLLQG